MYTHVFPSLLALDSVRHLDLGPRHQRDMGLGYSLSTNTRTGASSMDEQWILGSSLLGMSVCSI